MFVLNPHSEIINVKNYRPKNSFVIKYYFKITLLSLLSLLLENSNGSKMEVISDKPTRKFLSAITLWTDKAFCGLKRGPVITRQPDTGWLVFIK